MKPNPTCHSDKVHFGFGLCQECYMREWRYRTKYGITVQQYEEMVLAQNGLCLICRQLPKGRWNRLAVDHDHQTGEIRGLLCHHCNLTVGQIEEMGPLLGIAKAYLDNSPWRENR